MKSLRFIRCCAVVTVLVAPFLQAQPELGSSLLGENSSRKSLEIVRTDLVPRIDGILDDEIWETATVISDLHQYQPLDQAQPSERSEFFIAYGERYLYIAARLYDSDPSGISARQMVQGGNMPFDDAIEIVLDTFNNGRTGYYFQVNPNGIRREGVYENPNSLNRDWAGIWQVESRIDDQGWTAEIAIPFNTLNFDPASETWGFSIARTIARKKEEIAWSSFNRNVNPTTTGLITGIRDIRQGKGLDIIPSMTVVGAENFANGVRTNAADPSVNVFYKFTPSLTGALTINTDFAATEVDNRQVNLSRFSLFFPEKRDFFLQDVDIFNFGGLSQNGIPFYSRRIGLSPTGQPVDIDAGVKLTGRVGRWNVGGLAVQQGADGALDEQQVFVGRASANVLSESSIGAIFTHGDPTSDRRNSLLGTDFRYQNTRFTDNYTLRGNLWFQQTQTEGLQGDDRAYGVVANLNTQGNGVGGVVEYQYFGENFNPGLGFANRRGTERYHIDTNGRYFLKGHSVIRSMNMFVRLDQQRRLSDGDMQSENLFFRYLNINTHRGDHLGLSYQRNREGLERPFQIRPGVIIPMGKYVFSNLSMEGSLAQERLFAPFARVSYGDFYEGTRAQARGGFNWRPDEHLFLNFSYDYQDIALPQGSFDVKIISVNANYAFNSKWSWVNLVQYDNASQSAGVNSRLRWNPQAGEDFFLVVNYNFDSEGVFNRMSSDSAEIALKYTKTFRF